MWNEAKTGQKRNLKVLDKVIWWPAILQPILCVCCSSIMMLFAIIPGIFLSTQEALHKCLLLGITPCYRFWGSPGQFHCVGRLLGVICADYKGGYVSPGNYVGSMENTWVVEAINCTNVSLLTI